MTQPGFTLHDLYKCAEREVALRRNVYAKRGWTAVRAREIAMMIKIAELLGRLSDELGDSMEIQFRLIRHPEPHVSVHPAPVADPLFEVGANPPVTAAPRLPEGGDGAAERLGERDNPVRPDD